jgi:putative photosynthetic complex assembly protein 2
VRARDATNEGGGARSFFGGALCWTAVSAAFYGGWVVGPPPADVPNYTVLAHALDAIRATAYSSVLSAVLLGALVRGTRGGSNHVAVCTFALFWAVHELAKLNVFLGVVNPGTQFLPEYLLYLQRYFGPSENSGLLAASVLALLGLTGWLAWRARRAHVPARRLGTALLGAVALLAAFEHAVLGAPAELGWWDVFLALRGGQ